MRTLLLVQFLTCVVIAAVLMPAFVKAASATWGDCNEPAADPARYIADDHGVLDPGAIALVLDEVAVGSEGISSKFTYGDLIRAYETLKNTSTCFERGRYADALRVAVKGTGETAAGLALRFALDSVGLSGVTLPAEAMHLVFKKMLEGWEEEALRRQMILYTAAMGHCEIRGMSRSECHDQIVKKRDAFVQFYADADAQNASFIVFIEEGLPYGPLTSTKEVMDANGIKMVPPTLIRLSPADFYRGAYVLYAVRDAERLGLLDKEARRIESEVAEKGGAPNMSAPASRDGAQGFFLKLFETLTKPFAIAADAIRSILTFGSSKDTHIETAQDTVPVATVGENSQTSASPSLEHAGTGVAEQTAPTDMPSPNGLGNSTVPTVSASAEEQWSGVWKDYLETGDFEFSVKRANDGTFIGEGKELVDGQHAYEFSFRGTLTNQTILFDKSYANGVVVKYSGSVNGNTASGTWRQDLVRGRTGTWTMTLAP